MKQVCTKCVMDNIGDPCISFDRDGVSNYWKEAMRKKENEYFPNAHGEDEISKMIETIKNNSRNSEYDCIMGLSGGLDSSYLAYLASKWGLRILAVHCNDGFDEEIGISNVKNLVKYMGVDLINLNIDLEQFYSIIASYMYAGVPNCAVPQDNLIIAGIWELAKKKNIKYFLSGINYALECILQRGNTITNKDTRNLYDIHKRFGKGADISNLHFISPFKQDAYHRFLKIQVYAPLNYIDYNMKRAIKELSDACGFNYYGGKHYENTFTKFVQQIWLVDKFGVDKRKSHYSSLIASDQLTRDEALKMLEEPIISLEEKEKLISDLSSRIKISVDEIYSMLRIPGVQHNQYKTSKYLLVKNSMKKALGR